MSAPGPVRKAEGSRADWETPRPLFDLLDVEFCFELDGAANRKNRKCEKYLGPGSAHPDALTWEGTVSGSIFVNPPYGKGLDAWVRACNRWARDGRCEAVVALLPASTDTDWFALLTYSADEVRLLSGRVQFVDPVPPKPGEKRRTDNPSGSVVAVWRRGPLRRPEAHIWLWHWRDELKDQEARE